MARFHINPKTGNPGQCRAQQACPFGGAEDHYSSQEEARAAYERKQASSTFTKHSAVASRPHVLPLERPTEELLERLEAAGAQPLVVGGAVRDSLRENTPNKDVDIEVHGLKSMDELLAKLRASGYKVDEVGKQFGVLKTTLSDGMEIDLSLPRKDNRVGAGHRGFEVEVDAQLSLEEAAVRRDFTINALYYSHSQRAILDPHGGLADWEAGRLQHVSEAFREDPLRVLRGMQMASRFNLTMTEETAAECQAIKHEFNELSTERVQEEFTKLFTKSPSVAKGLETLRKSGWDEHFGLQAMDVEDASRDVDMAMAAADREGLPREILGAATLSRELPPKERQRFLKQALIGDKAQNKALRLANSDFMSGPQDKSPKAVKAWARAMGKDGLTVQEWAAMTETYRPDQAHQVAAVARSTNSYERAMPDFVTGAMILEETGSKKGGKWVGQLMREASQEQDNETFTDGESGRSWLRKRLETFSIV